MRNRKRILAFVVCCFVLKNPAWSADAFDLDAARRTLAQDNLASMEVIKRFQSPDHEIKDAVIEEVLRHPDSATPVVLYSLASALAEANRMKEAEFWYHVGKMRLQFDVMRNRDLSLGDLPTVLAMRLSKPLLQAVYVGNPDDMLDTVKAAIDWDNSHGHHYNPLWPAPHGLGVFNPGEEGLAPEAQWEEMNRHVHAQWLGVMTKAASEAKARQSISSSDAASAH